MRRFAGSPAMKDMTQWRKEKERKTKSIIRQAVVMHRCSDSDPKEIDSVEVVLEAAEA